MADTEPNTELNTELNTDSKPDNENVNDKNQDASQNENDNLTSKEPEYNPEEIEDLFKEDDNYDLENTPSNNEWLNSKRIIDSNYRTTGISTGLSNYGKNLILFYEKKIKSVNELMKRKKSDNKKNFIGDITIQEDQKQNIEKMILDDSKVKKVNSNDLKRMIESYYNKIGDKSGEIMQRDYDDRNRTIKYLLLIKEYEENIEKIRDAIKDYSGTDEGNQQLIDNLFGDISGGRKQKGGIKTYGTTDFTGEINVFKPISDKYSIVLKTYDLIGEKTTTNSILAIQMLYLLFQIQNAVNNPFIVNKGYFQLDELEETVMKLKIQNNNFNLIGGGSKLDNFLLNIQNDSGDDELLTNEDEEDEINKEIENEDLNEAENTKRKIDELLSKQNLNSDFIGPLQQFKEKIESHIALLQGQSSQTPTPTANTSTQPTSTNQQNIQQPNIPNAPEFSNQKVNASVENAQKALEESVAFNNEMGQHFLENYNSLAKQIKEYENEVDAVNNEKLTLKDKIDKMNEIVDKSIENIKQSASKCISTITSQTEELEKLVSSTETTLTNISDEIQKKIDEIQSISDKNNEIDKLIFDSFIEQSENEKTNEEIFDKIFNKLDQPLKNDFGYGNEISKKKFFIRHYIKTNYVKNNLYEFIQQCKNLDSVPEWRALISKLIVSYITSYVEDPNSKNEHVNVIPSYDYFNLVLMGTPGVGKSYTSAIVGMALKWSGFLTLGDLKEIKKPDIIGAYTGQTAPKVYNELTQALGKVVFIDEAYSIAGSQDKVKKTFNEYGQEALDAITDYTSEHIGLFAFIVAGYEYEMRHQFLDVNIGLPRRFPTVLTLRRYDMKSFWKILERPLLTFCPKFQVNHHHHGCFELLNLMFNYQCPPNPTIRLSKNWKQLWEGYKLNNLMVNLQLSMNSSDINKFETIPILRLTNLNQKLQNIESTPIMGETVEVIPYSKFFNKKNDLTTTFVKAFFIYKFTQILNGDFFRSQADNLTKFGQTILEDEIINPSGLFQASQNKNETGNIPWIEYLYFKLYFTRNPNKRVYNIEYEYVDPVVSGGAKKNKNKKKNYTVKKLKKKKYTKKINKKVKNKMSKKNKKHKKHNKKTARQRGGSAEDVEKVKTFLNYVYDKKYVQKSRLVRYDVPGGNKGIKAIKLDENEYIAATEAIPKMDSQELNETDILLQDALVKTQEIITESDKIKDNKTIKFKEKKSNPQYLSDNIIDNLNIFVDRIEILKNKVANQYIQDTPASEDLQTSDSSTIKIVSDFYNYININPSPENPDNKFPEIDENKYDNSINAIKQENNIEELKRIIAGLENAEKKADDVVSNNNVYNYLKNDPKIPESLDQSYKSIYTDENGLNNLLQFIQKCKNLIQECNKRIKQIESQPMPLPDNGSNLKVNEETNAAADVITDLNGNPSETDKETSENEEIGNNDTESNFNEQLQKENEGMGFADSESTLNEQKINEQISKTVDMRKKLKEELDVSYKKLPLIQKDLQFNVTGIDFAYLRAIPDLVENIIRNKSLENEENKKTGENDKLLPMFKNYIEDYGNYLNIYQENSDFKIDDKFINFVYVYLLLSSYYTAAIESVKEVGKFDKESWWFFTPSDFTDIKNDLDFEFILQKYDELTRKSSSDKENTTSNSELIQQESLENKKEDEEDNEQFKYFG